MAVAIVAQGRQSQAGATVVKIKIHEAAHVRGAATQPSIWSLVIDGATIGMVEIQTETAITAGAAAAVMTKTEGAETGTEITGVAVIMNRGKREGGGGIEIEIEGKGAGQEKEIGEMETLLEEERIDLYNN